MITNKKLTGLGLANFKDIVETPASLIKIFMWVYKENPK